MPLRLASYPVMVKAMPLLVNAGTLPTSDLPGGHRSLRGGDHWSPSSGDPRQILARAERIAVSEVGLQGIRRHPQCPLGRGSWLVADQHVLGNTARHGASGMRQIPTIAEQVAMAQVTIQICNRHVHRLFCWAARFVADGHPRVCTSRLSRNTCGRQVTARDQDVAVPQVTAHGIRGHLYGHLSRGSRHVADGDHLFLGIRPDKGSAHEAE